MRFIHDPDILHPPPKLRSRQAPSIIPPGHRPDTPGPKFETPHGPARTRSVHHQPGPNAFHPRPKRSPSKTETPFPIGSVHSRDSSRPPSGHPRSEVRNSSRPNPNVSARGRNSNPPSIAEIPPVRRPAPRSEVRNSSLPRLGPSFVRPGISWQRYQKAG